MKTYKVGDKVTIAEYDPNKDYPFGFTAGMYKFAGETFTISNIINSRIGSDGNKYKLKEDILGYNWDITMFEESISEESDFALKLNKIIDMLNKLEDNEPNLLILNEIELYLNEN